jgi:hypothetical protein
MGTETVIYLTNIIICAIIAALMTEAWYHSSNRASLRYWMIAGWVMLAADILFAARVILPPAIDRIAPTLLVSIGQVILCFGARIAAGKKVPYRWGSLIIAIHFVVLIAFYLLDPNSLWRRVANGLIWSGLSFFAFQSLRQSAAVFWRPLTAPAKVFALHSIFHLVRIISALVFDKTESATIATTIDIMGDLEVSFFMVALFVGLLVAHVQLRNEQLTAALAEVKALSGLLPICAWCKKIRDDHGYWTQVDLYFRSRTDLKFTHGVCSDCAENMEDEELNQVPKIDYTDSGS